MAKKKLVKSEAEKTDQFEIDEELVNEITDSDEFKDVDISTDDVMDAVAAIDALAGAVIEKADAEEKELDADALFDEIRDMIDETHEEDVELEEEEVLPEELTNAAVRVMVSEDGAIDLEQTPDEVYDSEIDGLGCTFYDTVDIPALEVEDTGDVSNTEDDLLVIGNSKSKSYRKGFVKLASSVSKKAWSAAYQAVKKLVKSDKLTAAHWAIVSALAKKEEEKDKMKKKIECAVIKKIRSNADLKKKLLKSDFSEVVEGQDTQEDIDDAGQPVADTKPEMTAGQGNPGFDEIGSPTEEKSPEIVDSQSGDPVEDPDKEVENNSVPVVEEEQVTLDVFVANSKRTLTLKKVLTNHHRNYSAYQVVDLPHSLYNALDGKVVKNGKNAFLFKDTANGLLACAANFIEAGKGTYTTVLKNNRVYITKGDERKIFNSVEKIMNFSARKVEKPAERKPVMSERRRPTIAERKREILNARRAELRKNAVQKAPVKNNREDELLNAKREVIRSRVEAKREINRAKLLANRNEAKLRAMHDAEERERLFQSSQNVMNEEKIAIKQGISRNSEALNRMYNNMF